MAATKKDGTDFSFIQFNSNFNEDFILKLPSQKKIHDLRWFGQQPTQTDFGDIYIEEKFESTERHKQTTEDSDYIYIFVEEVPSISMFLSENGYLASTIRNKNQEVELRYSVLNQEHYVLGHVIIPEVLKLPPTLAVGGDKETRFRMFEDSCTSWDMLGIQTTSARSAKVDKAGI